MSNRTPLQWMGAALVSLSLPLLLSCSEDSGSGGGISQGIKKRAAEMAASLASEVMERAGDLDSLPVEVIKINDFIFQATGIANTFLVKTSEGNVIIDTGLVTQGAKQKGLLLEKAPGKTHTIILSHAHADHLGGAKFWMEPDTEIIAHRQFPEVQRYLKELEPFFWDRNRTIYPFIPENMPKEGSLFTYGGVEPTRLVDDYTTYEFELGGVRFVVIPTPGAEGADNLCVWLPDHKILFSGDVFGPLFPMVPNLFTLRGEKFRPPISYIESLDTLIALAPELILPSHFYGIEGKEQTVGGMIKMRDATQYIHDETVKGMNAGKTVEQLMREIKLPPELELTEGHGMVAWDVRGIWEHYATWFHYDSTTALYPVPVKDVYPDVVAMGGGVGAFVVRAQKELDAGEPLRALHLVEMALAAEPGNRGAIGLDLAIHRQLLHAARAGANNVSEVRWLESRVRSAELK